MLLQAGTAVALFWMVQAIVYNTSALLHHCPHQNSRFSACIACNCAPSRPVSAHSCLPGAAFVSPGSRWLLDGLLTMGYGLQPLPLKQACRPTALKPPSHSSASAVNSTFPCLRWVCCQPDAPIAFSYGCLPHVTRTVVSQGLLEQLADDEIATIYASEIGHISRWDVPLLSLVMVLLQMPYTVYWQVSEWGDRKQADHFTSIGKHPGSD